MEEEILDENQKQNLFECLNCGAKLNDELYCPDCGQATGIKTCPNCRQKTVGEDYCTHCGYKINPFVKNCNSCGSKIDSKARVCPNCGAKVIHKSPILAVVLSFIFPGLGQLYNNQFHKGLILIIANIISYLLCLIFIGLILVLLIWVYGMYDAFVSAQALNNGELLEDRLF